MRAACDRRPGARHCARHRVGRGHAPRSRRFARCAAAVWRGDQCLPHHAPRHGRAPLRPAPGQSFTHDRRQAVHPRLGHDARRALRSAVRTARVHRAHQHRGLRRHPTGLHQSGLLAGAGRRPRSCRTQASPRARSRCASSRRAAGPRRSPSASRRSSRSAMATN